VRDYPRPPDDAERVAQLRSLAILDTDPEERFDRVTRLAQRLFGVPIALVSLVDADRQWFKSKQGLDATETPRADAFCTYAILGDEVLQVQDATTDPRFADNPLVLGAPEIRFYAGCPIEGPDGAKLGTLCIIDSQPRQLTDSDLGLLRDLAEMVEAEIAAIQMATGDQLTGLSNRRGFEVIGPEIMAICTTRSMRATLIYLDLDGLKTINDALGHEAGDRALREFADQLRGVFRGSDLIARIGGDEFAVMLVGEGDPTAIRRLRDALARRNSEAGAPYRLEASLGVSMFDPATPETLEALSARADAAMYEEKRRRVAGRAAS
jgi:diguanylate cyclase (GGDEF)-like protein